DKIKLIASEILKCLNPGGFLFLGLTENLMGMDLPITFLGSSIYRKTPEQGKAALPALPAADKPVAKLMRVLCVDDSKTVPSVLKNVLTPEFGFEVAGVAENGFEAAQFLKNNQVDLVTLDIHMPEQDGVQYLKSNFNEKHPPVVIVSTIAREDADL